MNIDPSVIAEDRELRNARRALDVAVAARSEAVRAREAADKALRLTDTPLYDARREWGKAWRAWVESHHPGIAEAQAQYRQSYAASADAWKEARAALDVILAAEDVPQCLGPSDV